MDTIAFKLVHCVCVWCVEMLGNVGTPRSAQRGNPSLSSRTLSDRRLLLMDVSDNGVDDDVNRIE